MCIRDRTTSIGISIYPDDGVDLDSLIDHADIAMYRCKMQVRETLALRARAGSANGGRGDPVAAHQIHPAQPADTINAGLQALQAQLDQAFHHLLGAAASAEQFRVATMRAHRLQAESLACIKQKLGESLGLIRAGKAVALQTSPAQKLLDLVPLHADVERHIANALDLLESM